MSRVFSIFDREPLPEADPGQTAAVSPSLRRPHMESKTRAAADGYDTWDAGWEERLSAYLHGAGFEDVWDYVRQRPGLSYGELAEELSADGGFGVAPVQIERLQVRDTPEEDFERSVRDSLARHFHAAFKVATWGEGAYWESRALGALGSWFAMWSSRTDLGPLKHRLFEMHPPAGWRPFDGSDSVLLELLPERA
jgi:hypothetical protein